MYSKTHSKEGYTMLPKLPILPLLPSLHSYQEVFLKNGNSGKAARKEERESNDDIGRKFVQPGIRSYNFWYIGDRMKIFIIVKLVKCQR